MVNIVTLDEVRRHLRYPAADTQDDAAFQLFIDAADEVMRKETGDNVPTQYIENYNGGSNAIYLDHKPVIEVLNVREGWGYANYDLDFVQVDTLPSTVSMFAYSLDSPLTGTITRRTAGNVNIKFMRGVNNIQVIYTAGRDPVPPVIRLAELELIAHWWNNSQQRASAQATGSSFDAVNQDFPRSGAALFTPINQGVPYRIIEMLKPYRSEPVIG